MRGLDTVMRLCATLAPPVAALLLTGAAASAQAQAQAPAAPAAAQPPRSPRAAAPIDLTGQWVAIVDEDWRWRMVTPPKGDFPGIPLTPAGREAANAWDPASDGSCKAYGVGGLMRMPTRLRIGWDGDNVLKIETDAGVQTRRLVFGPPDRNAPRSLQGSSAAQWERPNAPRNAPPRPGGDLKVVTTNTTGGWVRKNGVPYSENAVITEYFDRFTDPAGQEWLTVLTIVDDPANFAQPFLTSSQFKKETVPNRETETSKWRPRPCRPI